MTARPIALVPHAKRRGDAANPHRGDCTGTRCPVCDCCHHCSDPCPDCLGCSDRLCDCRLLTPCPTCQGRRWDVRLGLWVQSRETAGMVCQTCGWDYVRGEKP